MSAKQSSPPPPPGVTPNFEHPQDVLKTINMVSLVSTIVIIAPLVAGRVLIRTRITKMFQVEDYFCVVAWALGTGFLLTGIFMGNNGGGNHVWEVTKDKKVGFQQALYADTITYGAAAWFTKTTLLLIVIRAFSPYRRVIFFIYVFIGLMLTYYLPVMILKARICNPVEALWTPDMPAVCLDRVKLFYYDTIMSVFTDVVILGLPIPLVWSLHMSFGRKVRIVALLSAGGVATGASVVRLILVFRSNSFNDETVSFIRFNLLAVVEVGMGIICSCLPAFNILFKKMRLDRSMAASDRATRLQYISQTKISLNNSRDVESFGDEAWNWWKTPARIYVEGGECITTTTVKTHVERGLRGSLTKTPTTITYVDSESLTRGPTAATYIETGSFMKVPSATYVEVRSIGTSDPMDDVVF